MGLNHKAFKTDSIKVLFKKVATILKSILI